MTALRQEVLTLPAAELGTDNPLPALHPLSSVAEMSNLDELPTDMAERISYGRLRALLPYTVQDGYRRDRAERTVATVVLENEHLRATVLPEFGGRLWSLVDRATDRELLFCNPVLAFGNLALRGAWFAGGVEWNLGSTGHTTLTCAPLHVAQVDTPEGDPVLRLWEWERTRDLVYQVDLRLPADSRCLFVNVRVRNPTDAEAPLYWWSNIAVAQRPDTRVVAPATTAWRSGYTGSLENVAIPAPDGADASYPAQAPRAADYFFDIDAPQRPWIAALDADGYGLAHTSTATLRGRKLFCWGDTTGGRRWQEWLSGPGAAYLEIQAGLATTQLENLRLDAGAEVSWTEVYAPVRASGHDGDWPTARAGVEAALATVDAPAGVDAAHTRWRETVADANPASLLATGSAWGALELRARSAPAMPGTPFPTPAVLSEAAAVFAALLESGSLPSLDPSRPPPLPPITEHWQRRLTSTGWLQRLYRGLARAAAGDETGAGEEFAASLADRRTAWALHGLALLAGADRAGLLVEAITLAPDCTPLRLELAEAQLAAADPAAALDTLEGFAGDDPRFGRSCLLRARALVATGNIEAAASVFAAGFEIADIREGSDELTATWHAIAGDAPLPARYDFRMKNPRIDRRGGVAR
ncbi:MAG: DUF5107 domain-containing protein [Jatrophihabitans sp.]